MTHFGYPETTPGFKPERADRLAKELADLVSTYRAVWPEAAAISIESESYLGHGVYLRRLTGLTGDQLDQVVRDAEGIFREVMKP